MFDFAIAGDGRLARHFSEYFQLLEIPHARWARNNQSAFNSFAIDDAEQRLRATVAKAERVLLLVSDDAIVALLKQYPFLHEKQLIHCSGALSIPGVAGAHPLMTFTDKLYGLERYQSMPFMFENGYSFEQLFPGLANPHFPIAVEDKARYHALCVMAGNFTQILWKSVAGQFTTQLDLPDETLHPYMQQITENFLMAPDSSLTGPLVRNDQQTIARNIQALNNDPLQALYQAFVDYYQSNSSAHNTSGIPKMEQIA